MALGANMAAAMRYQRPLQLHPLDKQLTIK